MHQYGGILQYLLALLPAIDSVTIGGSRVQVKAPLWTFLFLIVAFDVAHV